MAGSNGVTYVNKVEIGTNQFDINDSRIKLTVTGASNIGDTLCISDVEMVNDQVEAVEMSNVKMTTDTVPVANDKNYVTTAEKTDWNSKQAGLSDSNKLNPAYVDTSGDDYKFVTQADITNWNGKQGLLTAGANIDITNGVISGAYPNAAAPSGADPGHSGLMTSTDKGLVSLLTYRWKRNNVEDFILTTTTGESGTDPEIVGVWYPDPDPDPTTNTGLYHQTLLVDGMTAD